MVSHQNQLRTHDKELYWIWKLPFVAKGISAVNEQHSLYVTIKEVVLIYSLLFMLSIHVILLLVFHVGIIIYFI